ncbi:MAG: hypothetical protein OXF50_03255 [Caldilineaceae bacterium]|nr:hypothetical protein [Caldilineaceae bacterium]
MAILPAVATPQKLPSRPDGGRPPVDYNAETDPAVTAISYRVNLQQERARSRRVGPAQDP